MSTVPNQLPPACRRRDHVMAAYVDASAIIRTRLGAETIERFARDAGVPFHVVLRVLMAGGPRRPCARFHEPARQAGPGDDSSAASSAYFRVPMTSAAEPWGVNRRVDGQTALLVDAAISAAASHGVAGAAAELIDPGLPVEFVFRVLCNPGLRRRYLSAMPMNEGLPAPGQAGMCRRRNRLQAAYVQRGPHDQQGGQRPACRSHPGRARRAGAGDRPCHVPERPAQEPWRGRHGRARPWPQAGDSI